MTADIQPMVFVRNGAALASSKDVAAFFGKQHGHVLRDIRALNTSPDLERCSWFTETTAVVGGGHGAVITVPAFDMTRDGFVLLAMGFTGAKALAFKIRYIAAFNRMEAALHSSAVNIERLIHERVAAAIAPLVEQVRTLLVEHDPRSVATDYLPMLDIVSEAGVAQKGRRAVVSRASGRCRRWCVDTGRADAIKISRETGRYLFHKDVVRDWMKQDGAALITAHKEKSSGQGVLSLVKPRSA